jgi:protein-tyrosine phosphatase
VIDLHSHVLPGIDDGPSDMAGSLALAQAAVDAGTQVLAATPHIGLAYPVVPLELSARVWELERALDAAGIDLEVVTGGEIAPSSVSELSEPDLAALGLGGGSCVLVECPFTPAGDLILRVIDHLHERGLRVLLAHPERSPTFLRDVRSVQELVERGAFVQLTASSLVGSFGRPAWRFCSVLLERGLAHVVASDAHGAVERSPELVSIVEDTVWRQGLPPELANHLVEAVPRALLDDAPIPAGPLDTRRPSRRPRRQ